MRRAILRSMVTVCIATAALTASGQIYRELPASPFAAGSFPQEMAFTPDGRWLFVLNHFSDSLSVFGFTPTGLVPVPGSPFATQASAADVTASMSFVFVCNNLTDSVTVWAIGADGSLSEVAGSPFATSGATPQNLEVAPSGEILIVSHASGDSFDVFLVDPATGGLNAVVGSPFPAGDEPQGIAIDSDSHRVVIANCMGDSLSAFTLDPATKTPVPAPGSPFSHPDCPLQPRFHPSGDWLYVDALNSFDGYAVGANASLTALAGSPFAPPPGFSSLAGIAVLHDGRRVLTCGSGGGGQYGLVVYEVGSGGELAPSSFIFVPLARASFEVEAHTDGARAVTADSVDGSVSVFEPVILEGVGRAVPNGSLAPGEWGRSLPLELQVDLPGGGTTTGFLRAMTDGGYLFLSLELDTVGASVSSGVFFELDPDHSADCTDGDDIVGVSTGFVDSFRTGGCMQAPEDVGDGGSTDGAGAMSPDRRVYELAHPLASGDLGHDIQVVTPAGVGFWAQITLCDLSQCATTNFPGGGQAQQGLIALPPLVFLDDFESGGTGYWSSALP